MFIEKKSILSSLKTDDVYRVLDLFDSPQQVAGLMQPYRSAVNQIKAKLESLEEELQGQINHNPIHHMEYRIKSLDSIFDKIQRKGWEMELDSVARLTDIAGLRVICHYIEDIYIVAELLAANKDLRILRQSDYIRNPKPNGYRSLHIIVETDVYLVDGKMTVPVEIQLRTIAMDFWASLEHQIRYKMPEEVPQDTHQKLKECAEIINFADWQMQEIYRSLNSETRLETHDLERIAGELGPAYGVD